MSLLVVLTPFAVFGAEPAPYILWPKSMERTTFQQQGRLGDEFDLRTDVAMPYGINERELAALDTYKDAGYVMHLMTGVSWGNYTDYLDGKFDGLDHWDQGQRDAANRGINHGVRVPYMVPSVSFSRFLELGLNKAIESGVEAVHMEEPEFWARAGFSESFKRAWQIYYNEPWIRPDSSCDAQYRASKLKHYLYRRTLSHLAETLKEKTLLEQKRPLKFYVPTHSLLNYTQWSIVSPESALLDLPGIDGLICQTWTGTARTANIFGGVQKERTFETAFLEYGSMQELARGSGKRMYLLHDPIEDQPTYDWDDYRKNYVCTLIASLLAPDSHYYEVCPWPARVFKGKYPSGSPDALPIPKDYGTTLLTVFNQLRDMDQAEIDWTGATDGIGVFLSDSAMFQRAEPYIRDGAARNKNDSKRPDRDEIQTLSAFYGMVLPLVKHGVPVRPVILENAARYPGYLDRYKVLVLSYEFQKPYSPGFHAIIADWVRQGGTLVYVGGDTDPFHQAKEWWNADTAIRKYATPREHLFESLGLAVDANAGTYDLGKGKLVFEDLHPAYYTRSKDNADAYRNIIRSALKSSGTELLERNHFMLRRGPYLIAAVMDESISDSPLELNGRFIDLLDAELSFITKKTVSPGQQIWMIDMDKMTATAPAALTASGRVESWTVSDDGVKFRLEAPTGISTVVRLLLKDKPKSIMIDEKETDASAWDWNAESSTLLIRHSGTPKGNDYAVQF